MITRHGPVVATEIADSAISTAKIAASAVTAVKLNSTALDTHIARGTQTGGLAAAGKVTIDTGLTSPVVAVANIIGSGAGVTNKIGFADASGAYAIFWIQSQATASKAFGAAASATSKSVAWVAWET